MAMSVAEYESKQRFISRHRWVPNGPNPNFRRFNGVTVRSLPNASYI